jgi:hypothetical protein
LDTGSSDTYLDKNILYIEQISLKDSASQVEVETANGRISGIISNYSGVLGMDILKTKNLCLHFSTKDISFGL